ncbi:uncharacterized protein L3040_009012 [Drepanopeziza brunnea f. sp. 'multigermtubi']|nr:hypothetical protein L3040_009012 [Drepanopeziza brunnea f. sp. 'multigermtubi']
MKSTLYKLPTELREMVFKYSLAPEWDGKMPGLIKALRSDKDLYAECIHAWRKHKHTYILSEKNNWSFLDMPKKVIATITKVRIMVDEDIALHPLLRWSDMAVIHERFPMSIHDLSLTAALATSVTSVTLDCRPKTSNLYFWYPSKFTMYLSGFPVLTYVEITCPLKPNSPVHEGGGGRGLRDEEAMVNSAWQEMTMKKAVRAGNLELGVLAKLKMVYADVYWEYGNREFRKFEYRDAWIWIAEEGKTLNKIDLPPGLMMTGPRKRRGLFR